jgi:ATP-binding cassette subfamily B protein/subfamily B ATP-binding cassette protein MsbA
MVTGMVLVMWRLDTVLTVLALGVAPLITGSSLLLARTIRASARIQRRTESRINAHVQQTLTGIAVVQAFGREEEQHHQFRVLAGAAIRARVRSALAGGVYEVGAGLCLTLGLAAVLWVGARHVLEGRLTVGGILVFLTYVTSLQEEMRVFTNMYSSLQEARVGAERVMEVLEAEREVVDQPGARPLPAARGEIVFDQVTFGYQGWQPVLRDIELEVPAGQTLALVGPSGAGKTTLVSLVPRFFDPWAGLVLVDGQDVRELTLRSLRDQVGIVLQEPFLFPLSVAENIAYGRPRATRSQIEAAARAANAHDFISRLPAGYDTVVGERGATLSGGERQRLAIARALVKDAPILILDEPTSALDAETEALLLEALQRLMAGRTTLIIAHRLSTIRDADTIAVLQAGQLVEHGSHQQLLRSDGAYTQMYEAQFRLNRRATSGG